MQALSCCTFPALEDFAENVKVNIFTTKDVLSWHFGTSIDNSLCGIHPQIIWNH